MGNETSVNLNDGRTVEEIRAFIKKVEGDTARLEKKAEELSQTIQTHPVHTDVETFLELKIDADCLCNVPKQAFLDREVRKNCADAQLRAAKAQIKALNSSKQLRELVEFHNELTLHVRNTNGMIGINKPFFFPDNAK